MLKPGHVVEWRTFPKQSFFLSREEDEIMYGGRPGGGKTIALLLHNILRRHKYPGSSGLFLRREREDLKKAGSAIPLSHKLLTGWAEWNGTDLKWTFPNGSVLEFGGCKDEDDKYRYRSGSWIDIQFDELTGFTQTQYEFIAFSRARGTVDEPQIQIRSATNPGDIGNAWVYKRFLVPMAPYETYEYETQIETGARIKRRRMFVPSSFWDNPFINREAYAASLQEITDPAEAKAMAGRWDIFEGQVFTEWNPGLHVVAPFTLPVEWRRWWGVDYGYDSPWCALWIAQNMDLWRAHRIPRYYCYRERYGPGVRVHDQPLIIRRASGNERIVRAVADASMWQGYREGTSLIWHYEKIFGPGWVRKGPLANSRVSTKALVHWLLGNAQDGLPRLQIFSSCENLIRTLPMLQYDKHKADDVDTDQEDHPYDCLRYLASMLSIPAVRHAPQPYLIGAAA